MGDNYQATETSCADRIDNDCDGTTDADDNNCYLEVCLAILKKNGLSRTKSEAACSDMIDNDCDRAIDCEDRDCPVSRTCGFGGFGGTLVISTDSIQTAPGGSTILLP
jgi:hypothetical protein